MIVAKNNRLYDISNDLKTNRAFFRHGWLAGWLGYFLHYIVFVKIFLKNIIPN